MYYNSEDEEEFEEPTLEILDISNDQYYQDPSEARPLKSPSFIEQLLEGGGHNNRPSSRASNRSFVSAPSVKSNKEIACLHIPQYGSKTINHSLPAYDLWRPFFPTYLSEDKFRQFHRPKLRHYNLGPQSRRSINGFYSKTIPIKNLTKLIYRQQQKLKARITKDIEKNLSRDRIISRNLLILNTRNLTAKHGELFLFEYSEEFPPILSQNGMASNVKTYIQPHQQELKSNRNLKNNSQQQSNLKLNSPLGQQVIENFIANNKNHLGLVEILTDKTKQIYYNKLKPGSKIQMIENNLYRAPIYPHRSPSCDFLIIRTRNGIYIREIENIFTVGQTMPLKIIPKPTEKSISKFRCDFSNIYINKLFKESLNSPASFHFNSLKKLFPDYHKSVLITRLRMNGAEYDRDNEIVYIGSSKYGLQSKKEIRSCFTPEEYCINMTMIEARERLRELNYTESMIDPPNSAEYEPEVLAAPWNTSSAVNLALKGRSYLDFKSHLIDPTGVQKEGFSCVAWSKSLTEDQQIKEQLESRCNFDKRTNSGDQANQSFQAKNPMAGKITREKLERLAIYQREAQMISEVQSRVLSSAENLSSDEEEEDDDDENVIDASLDEQLRDLDKLLSGKTIEGLNFEKEEEERQKMMKEFNGKHIEIENKQASPDSSSDPLNVIKYQEKVLKIIRTYENKGELLERTEIVRDPRIIALYVKHRVNNHKSSQNESCMNEDTNQHVIMSDSVKNTDILNQTTATCGAINVSLDGIDCSKQQKRRSSVSLGPGELCRADGIKLTINKKVLSNGRMRRPRSCKDMSF